MYQPTSKALFASLLLSACAAGPAWGNVQGKAYSTDNSGTGTNVNQFQTKDQVYIAGGPQNGSANGLIDGKYVFQITDPSGKTLLSTDEIGCRMVLVTGGRILGLTTDPSLPCVTGLHNNGTADASNTSQPVQMGSPFTTPIWFLDTPNGGGVYKLWVTPIGSYSAGSGNFGFSDGESKTDSFKIIAAGSTATESNLTGTKYYDANGNGVFDTGEDVIAGVTITVTGSTTPGGPFVTTTDSNGVWSIPLNIGDTFTACETVQPGWTQSGPLAGAHNVGSTALADSNHCWTGTVGSVDTTGLDFGNNQQVSGKVYFDLNRNGVNDLEAGVAGFTITVTSSLYPLFVASPVTDANGRWFAILPAAGASFLACEAGQIGWTQSGPLNGAVAGTATATAGGCWSGAAQTVNLDFGNYIRMAGRKHYDPNGTGTGTGLSGWSITVTCTGGSGSCSGATTNASGDYAIYPTGPISSYTVCETLQGGWTQAFPKLTSTSGGATVTTVSSVNCWTGAIGTASGTGLDFGNYIQLSGLKFYDADASGLQNGTEAGIAGFRINITYCNPDVTCTLSTASAVTTQVTTAGAAGSFTWSAPGPITSYLVCEVLPTTGGWVQTSSGNAGNCWSGVVGSASQTALKFGNICQGAGGALSKGFWSNKNGQSVLGASDPRWRHLLNGESSSVGAYLPMLLGTFPAGEYLRNLDGTFYTVSDSATAANASSALGTFLTNASNGSNMASQLSTQTAAMVLNVDMVGGVIYGLGPVAAGAKIFAGPAPSVCGTVPGLSAGFISVTDLLNYSVGELRSDGKTSTTGTDRTCQTWAETALDNANNNRNFVQGSACPVVYP